MKRMSIVAVLAAVLSGLAAAPAQGAISRTYVASYGSDANTTYSCDFAHPCRTFQTALSQTLAGGEILAMDGSGYGPVTIDRSVSIIANPGVFAGIGVFSTSNSNATGVYINTAGVSVVLRGLTINGQTGAIHGVEMANGAKLSVENCVFAGLSGTAVFVHTAATVHIINTLARDNGIGVFMSNGALTSISGSQFIANTNVGIVASGGSITVSGSMVTRNAVFGLVNQSGGTLKSLGNNNVSDNTSANTYGTITTTPLM